MIPHNKLTIGDEEHLAAHRVLSSGWLAQGPEVEAFENELCEFLGLASGHAVAFSSCSVAHYFALWVLNAKGKTVTFPVYVSRVLRGAVAMSGGIESLLDVEPNSPNIDLDVAKILSPDILIAPHMYGLPIDLSGLDDMKVIENCAHCLGGKVRGGATGLQGIIGVFSFQATKLMTSGGMGGMLVSKDKQLVDEVRGYRDFDNRRDMGAHLNFRMTDIQGAIGRAQLRKLPQWLDKRSRIFEIYKNEGLDMLDVPRDSTEIKPVRYRAVVRTEFPQNVIQKLATQGVKSIVPIEDWELLGAPDKFPHALNLTKSTVSLPIYPALTEEQAKNIALIFKESK